MVNSIKEGNKDLTDVDKMTLKVLKQSKDDKLANLKAELDFPEKRIEELKKKSADLLVK